MKDRLRQARQAAADLAGKAQHLRPGGPSSDDPETDDEDEVDEELPALDVSDAAHEELVRLDEGEDGDDEAPDVIETRESFFDLLRKVDSTPPLPLAEVHEVGLATMLRRLSELGGAGFVEDGRVKRVLAIIGDRLSISVGPKGITVRSLIRRKHTPWKRVRAVKLEGRYEMARGDGVAKLMESVRSAIVPFPVPGLTWLLRKVCNSIADFIERRMDSEGEIAAAREGAWGNVFLGVKRWGPDVGVEGPLLLVALMSPGLADAIEGEARARGIAVDVAGQ
jgi:hypothetical protein